MTLWPIRAVLLLAFLVLPASPALAAEAVAPSHGMWLTQAEVSALPMSGAAWDKVSTDARATWPAPLISDQDNQHGTFAFAGALYYARTGDAAMRTKVRDAIMAARETENGGRVLALGRNLLPYVLAADLINLGSYSATDGAAFRTWLSGVRTEAMTECTNLNACHQKRPNNWGTHSGASRIAADIYLGDTTDLAAAATVFRGYAGERSAYAAFSYGDLSWQCNASAPVGVNPAGCTKSGYDIDGVIPDDQRRCGTLAWPPCKTNYAWEALQGATVQAHLLSREGYDGWKRGDEALRRAADWLYTTTFADGTKYPAADDDTWIPWLLNSAYGTTFAASTPTRPGKSIGYTDWTHARTTTTAPPPTTPAPTPTADTQAPSAPASLSATARSETSISVSWSSSTDDTGVTGYKVYKDGAPVADVTSATAYTFTGLTCATSYALEVRAFDAAGNVSAPASLTAATAACAPTGDTEAPSAPTNLRQTSSGSPQTAVSLAWDAAQDNVGVTGYHVFVDGVRVADAGTALSYTHTGLTCGTTHRAEVKAYDAAGNISASSGVLGVSTEACQTTATTAALRPGHDAYVDSTAPSRNFGGATVLFLEDRRRVYMRFAVPGGTPKSAKLRFYAVKSSSYGVSVSKATGASAATWDEKTLTYSNAPTFGTAIGTTASVRLGWNEVTIPPAQLDAGAQTTFVISRTATTRVDIHSDENTYKPELVVTY